MKLIHFKEEIFLVLRPRTRAENGWHLRDRVLMRRIKNILYRLVKG